MRALLEMNGTTLILNKALHDFNNVLITTDIIAGLTYL